MEFMTPIDIRKLPDPISYQDRLMLAGSCFTEHIGNTLELLKFKTLQNPNGILFDPASVCNSLISYIENRQYNEDDLFQLNEVWHSWRHHSRYSNISSEAAVKNINSTQRTAHEWLSKTDWLVITLGSSFSHRLTDKASLAAMEKGSGVANCHRAPADWFQKHLLSIEEIIIMLDNCYHRLRTFNSNIKILFTISPVRHLRDGVTENNRSKARLIESVHHIVNKFNDCYYFPAYELVIDVLRDYRFFDIDFAHPNYAATQFVLEKFMENCVTPEAQDLMQEIKKIQIARKHKPLQPDTNAHKVFMKTQWEKINKLQTEYASLDFSEELAYFKQ